MASAPTDAEREAAPGPATTTGITAVVRDETHWDVLRGLPVGQHPPSVPIPAELGGEGGGVCCFAFTPAPGAQPDPDGTWGALNFFGWAPNARKLKRALRDHVQEAASLSSNEFIASGPLATHLIVAGECSERVYERIGSLPRDSRLQGGRGGLRKKKETGPTGKGAPHGANNDDDARAHPAGKAPSAFQDFRPTVAKRKTGTAETDAPPVLRRDARDGAHVVNPDVLTWHQKRERERTERQRAREEYRLRLGVLDPVDIEHEPTTELLEAADEETEDWEREANRSDAARIALDLYRRIAVIGPSADARRVEEGEARAAVEKQTARIERLTALHPEWSGVWMGIYAEQIARLDLCPERDGVRGDAAFNPFFHLPLPTEDPADIQAAVDAARARIARGRALGGQR